MPRPYRKPPPEPPDNVRASEIAAIDHLVAAKLVTKLPAAPARILGESSPGWRHKADVKATANRNRYTAQQRRLAKRILPEPPGAPSKWQRPRPSPPPPERPTLRKRSRPAPD